MAEKILKSIKFPGLEDTYIIPQGGGGGTSSVELDKTLTIEGKAADAKAAGDRLKALENPTAPLSIEKGGTGANTASGALTSLGAMSNTLVSESFNIYPTTGDTLDKTLEDIFTSMTSDTNKIILATRKDFTGYEDLVTERFSLGCGSDWMMIMTKSSSKFGSIIAWQYGNYYFDKVIIKSRTIYNGKWGEWVEHSDIPMKELWRNPDCEIGDKTVASFSAKSITLDNWASKFNCLMVICRHSLTYGFLAPGFLYRIEEGSVHRFGCCYFPASPAGTLHSTDSLMSVWRYFKWDTDPSHIALAVRGGVKQKNLTSYSQAAADDGVCIPMRVYGMNM